MDTPDKREEFARLVSRLLDEDTLTPEERSQLNETLLADADARRLYMHYIDMQLEFACITEHEVISEEQLADIVKQNAAPLARLVADDSGDSNWTREVNKTPRKRWPEMVLAAAAAVVIIGFTIKNVQRPATQPAVGLVENATGEVQFVSSGSETEDATPGIQVRADQTLVTKGDKSSAVFVFDDDTSLVVAGDTQISTVDGAKRIQVTNGAVAASVSPQPVGKPLIVSTPIADIEVVGTRFSVNHQSDLTDLAVTQGVVMIRRHSDGYMLKVPAGKRVFAGSGGIPRLESIPTLASSWRADFEDGQRHANCHLGEPITEGLPDKSRGAIQASSVEDSNRPGNASEQIAFGSPWVEGLVLAREKTHLHIRYKLENPGPLQIQVDTRTDGPKPQLASYQFDQFEASAPGQWINAHIPLTKFQNPNDSSDQTMAGEIPLNLLVVARVPNTGLVIDEISLNSSGTGKFESAPVQ
ncbi:MAG: anti-sigma-K factor RskA [Verrucomicrobiales bacterium]|jgi:anti-sigma-K factor RskA